MTELRDTGH